MELLAGSTKKGESQSNTERDRGRIINNRHYVLLRVQEYSLGTQLLSDSGQQNHLYIYVYHKIMISQSMNLDGRYAC